MLTRDDDYRNLQALTVERSNDLVYDRLRDAIITGDLSPGQRLVEARLATRLGVSRAPIREAIRVLEREGLVQSIPRRGSAVAMLSKEDVREIYGLRAALECAAVREVTVRANPELIERLTQLVAEMERGSHDKDRELLAAEDVAFHSAICEMAGNARLLRVWLSIHGQIRLLSRQVIGTVYQDLTPIPHRHELILEAIRAGDANAAEATIREHISSVVDQIMAAFPASDHS